MPVVKDTASNEWRRISHKVNLTSIVCWRILRFTVIIKSSGPLRTNFRPTKNTTSPFITPGHSNKIHNFCNPFRKDANPTTTSTSTELLSLTLSKAGQYKCSLLPQLRALQIRSKALRISCYFPTAASQRSLRVRKDAS